MSWLDWTNIVAAVTVSTALNSIWLGILLAGLASVMVRLVPRSNAATRHAIWFTALLLVIVTPVLLLIPRPTTASALASPAVASAPLTVPVTAQWPVYAMLAWLAIAAILLARVAWSIAYIHGLKQRATSIGQRGSIRVLASSEARVPMAAGFLHRAIVFPQSVLDELTPQEFEQVLSHESAHLRRWDDWTQLAHAIADALLFFNPAIYWIGRHLKSSAKWPATIGWSPLPASRGRMPCASRICMKSRAARRLPNSRPAPRPASAGRSAHAWRLCCRRTATRHRASLAPAGWRPAPWPPRPSWWPPEPRPRSACRKSPSQV